MRKVTKILCWNARSGYWGRKKPLELYLPLFWILFFNDRTSLKSREKKQTCCKRKLFAVVECARSLNSSRHCSFREKCCTMVAEVWKTLVLEQLSSSSVFWVRDTQFVGEDPKVLEVVKILGKRIENFSFPLVPGRYSGLMCESHEEQW